MDLTVVMLDGTSCTLKVNPQDTVGHLKNLIQGRLRVPPERQSLVFVNSHRIPLNDDTRSVGSYGLESGCQVSLLLTQPPTFQVLLRNLKGELSTYDIKPDETVSNFKKRVQGREGVPVSQQRLTFQSRDMMDGNLLSDYNVTAHSTIELTSRLRGG
ncbi:polyubiquitin-like [Pempheris klunzingeri]|uniref:polyubiquitin-like n=1 Tax=Pempheris klunzingeri TaxID=3127111 RepID=UPI00398171F2